MKRPTAGFKKREVLEKACEIGKVQKTITCKILNKINSFNQILLLLNEN